MKSPAQNKRRFLSVGDLVLFAMFGAFLFASTVAMAALPNIHLVGMMTVTLTVVYRARALIPLYLFVFLFWGLQTGFAPYCIPYLYIWTVLWGATMLVPRSLPRGVRAVIYPILSGLNGLLFGVLWAPVNALLFGLDLHGMLAWIASGFPYDVMHAVSNFGFGLLILPLSELLEMLEKKRSRR